MKLQNKLTLLTAGILVGTSVAIGGAAIFSVQNAEMDRIDGQLGVAIRAVQGDTIDPLSTALLAADQSEIGLTVALRDFNGNLVVLAESQAVLTALPSEQAIAAAEKRAVTVDGISTTDGNLASAYRLRTVELASGDELLLATSLDDVIANRDSNLQRLIWFILAVSAIGSGLVALVIRRDMRKVSRLVEAAGGIADGKSDVKLSASGNAEIDELSRALERMVASLQLLLPMNPVLTQILLMLSATCSVKSRIACFLYQAPLMLPASPSRLESKRPKCRSGHRNGPPRNN